MIFNGIALLVGAVILGVGLMYLVREWKDKESRLIYGITSIVGAAITVWFFVRFLLDLL